MVSRIIEIKDEGLIEELAAKYEEYGELTGPETGEVIKIALRAIGRKQRIEEILEATGDVDTLERFSEAQRI
jgi:hypothetical protein